jgi:hypothetical protein
VRITHRRVRLAACILTTICLTAAAQVPPSLRACATEPDDGRRLACYDREMARLPPETSAATNPERRSGLQGEHPQASPPRELVARVVKVSPTSSGGLVIELDDGQIWRQAESAPGFDLEPGSQVTIKPGALKSFWLSDGKHPSARVRRVQ